MQEGDTQYIQSVTTHLWWVTCFWYFAKLIQQVYEIFYFYFAPFSMYIFQFVYINYYAKQKGFVEKSVQPDEDAA